MRVAHFVQRYPPALGGSEDYFARLSRYLAAAGDRVTVFTTTAVDLPAFWSTSGRCLRRGWRRSSPLSPLAPAVPDARPQGAVLCAAPPLAVHDDFVQPNRLAHVGRVGPAA